MSDRWLKALLMTPAYAAISVSLAREKIKHAARRRIGNAALQPTCCDENPSRFSDGTTAKSLPAMQDKLERTSVLFAGYCPVYCCRVCGQEWIEEWEQERFGGTHTLSKFSDNQAKR